METQIIDFAQWYSGMERSKVEAAYQRYLKERRDALSQAAVSGNEVAVCSHKWVAKAYSGGRECSECGATN